ncbi:MAG: hypothetical protein KGN16_15005 [Burkholderiales bacterium]|nr:hypothetical protein [Burkholderiales bacterium]
MSEPKNPPGSSEASAPAVDELIKILELQAFKSDALKAKQAHLLELLRKGSGSASSSGGQEGNQSPSGLPSAAATRGTEPLEESPDMGLTAWNLELFRKAGMLRPVMASNSPDPQTAPAAKSPAPSLRVVPREDDKE